MEPIATEIRQLLRQLAPHLDEEKWTLTILCVMRRFGLVDVALLLQQDINRLDEVCIESMASHEIPEFHAFIDSWREMLRLEAANLNLRLYHIEDPDSQSSVATPVDQNSAREYVHSNTDKDEENKNHSEHSEEDTEPGEGATCLNPFSHGANAAVIQVVKNLELEGYFPNKISFSDIVRLREEDFDESKRARSPQIDALAWTVLKGILAYDKSAREISTQNADDQEDQDSSGEEDTDDSDVLHPMDVLQACFLCCDPEVQQILCKALFACKLAFPLIYRDCEGRLTLSQWNLRDIVVDFRDSEGLHVETSLVSEHPFPVVCFARIGEIGSSKSKLLNSLLSKNSQDTFFHRDCSNGTARRQCTNGLVEATIFLPSKGQLSSFSRAFVIANFRGDIMQHKKETDIVAQKAQIIVLLVENKALQSQEVVQTIENLNSRQIHVLIVLYNKSGKGKEKSSETVLKSLRERSEVVLAYKGSNKKNKTQLVSDVSKKLEGQLLKTPGKMLAEETRNDTFSTDESGATLAMGKYSSLQVVKHITASNVLEFKAKHLPLQELWLKFSQLHRQEHSSKAEKGELLEVQSKKAKQREAQFAKCKSMSLFLKDLKKSLESHAKSEDGLAVKLFLQWIKLHLDEISRKTLPELHTRRNKIRSSLQITCGEIKIGRTTDESKSQIKDLIEKRQNLYFTLQEIETKIVGASIGLENVFREICQCFEATFAFRMSSEISVNTFSSLPEVFARLLLWGIPLEILDGDASNIPLTWVTSVLSHCQQIVGPKKIFAVSVLGLQSSGKSTLLNTMFGLKFAVSAGRCTRGAFLQLVPVEPGRPFDFVAVIDTEGLRAPELGLDKHHHDNELATLVVGLGDVTVINLKGENTAEIMDILQIVVHAFIRMKMANSMRDLRRKCIFVHQNVPAVGAKEKMMDANFKMQEVLDNITREAAEGEKLLNIDCFSDIISFDCHNDIFYASDLWQGDPPMAPVNPGYSFSIRKIKSHILHCLDNEPKSFRRFDDFALCIEDLWKAIMTEDFVFSFRNSVEMKAYNILESEFFEIKTLFDAQLHEWLTKNASVRVKKSTATDILNREKLALIKELNRLIDECEESGKQRLERFFEQNPYSEHTIQWKSGKTNSLTEYLRSVGCEIRKKLDLLCDFQLLETEQMSKQSEWEREILLEAKRAAEEMPEGCPPEVIEQKFGSLWSKFTADLPAEGSEKGDSVYSKIERFLRNCYPKEISTVRSYMDRIAFDEDIRAVRSAATLTREQLFEADENTLFEIDVTLSTRIRDGALKLLTFGEEKHYFEQKMRKKAQDCLTSISNKIIRNVQILVIDISHANRWFEENDAYKVQKCVTECLQRELSVYQDTRITMKFEIKLVILSLSLAYPYFVELDNRFHESCSIMSRTNQIKERIRNTFANMVKRQSCAAVAADYVRDHLKKIIRDAIGQRMKEKLKSKLIKEIGNGKFYLVVRMLEEFAKNREFEKIIDFASNSETAALQWLKSFILGFLSKKQSSNDTTRLFSAINYELIEPIFAAVHDADEKANTDSAQSFSLWIAKFCKNVETELAVVPQDLENVFSADYKYVSSITLADFTGFFRAAIKKAHMELQQEYRILEARDIDSVSQGETLCRMVLNSFWGCRAQCPFCFEPCCKDDAKHYEREGTPHVCLQHRPQGVRGTHYEHTLELVFRNCELDVSQNHEFYCIVCHIYGRLTPNCATDGEWYKKRHSYAKYKDFFYDWDIRPDPSNCGNKFWMWFCASFATDLSNYYEKPVNGLPPAWKCIDEKEALASLRRWRT